MTNKPSKFKSMLIALLVWPLIKESCGCNTLRELIKEINKDLEIRPGEVTKEVEGEFTY